MVAIILAGGFGTRLKSVVSNVPKPMAEINGNPFMEYILQYLIKHNIKKVVMSVGYKHEVISNYFGSEYKGISIFYVIEDTPLGTGGAIKKCLPMVDGNNTFVINGDSFFNVDLDVLYSNYKADPALCSLSLKKMRKFERYGSVEIDSLGNIKDFIEKKYKSSGYINGGVYLVSTSLFNGYNLPENFSFESFIQENFKDLCATGYEFDEYFIDIGIPEDYIKAQTDFPKLL